MRLPKLNYAPYRSEYDAELMASRGDRYEQSTPWTWMRLANIKDPVPVDYAAVGAPYPMAA